MPASGHIPVLLQETVQALNVQPGGRYIDCTLGGGGHAAAILERSYPGGQLLGIDADPQAIRIAGQRLSVYRNSVLLACDNFVNLQAICVKYDFFPVHGIIFDLGLSSFHLNGSGRGFSFQNDAPLDMRFNPAQELNAADVVNTYAEEEISRLLREYGEETASRRIARRIVEERPIRTTLQLARLVEKAVGGGRRGRIHPATRTFQALRIAVNDELDNLKSALRQSVELLGCGGRLVVISYHSLEDRIVKQFMQREASQCLCPPKTPVCVCGHEARLKLVNRKVLTPSPEEVESNPRSRSARLRVAERIGVPGGCGMAAVVPDYRMVKDANGWRRPAILKRLKMVFATP